MSNENHVAPVSATNQPDAHAGSATALNDAAQALTAEGVRAIFQEMLNPFAKQIRKLGKQSETEPVREAQGSDKSLTELQALRQSVEAMHSRGQARTRNNAILEAGRELGVPPERMKAFKVLVEAEYGNQMKVFDDDSVAIDDPSFPDPRPLRDVLGSFLKSADGEIFKPAVRMPSSSNLRSGSSSVSATPAYHELPKEVRDKMTPEQKTAAVKADFARGKGN